MAVIFVKVYFAIQEIIGISIKILIFIPFYHAIDLFEMCCKEPTSDDDRLLWSTQTRIACMYERRFFDGKDCYSL